MTLPIFCMGGGTEGSGDTASLVLLSLDDNLYILSSDEDGWLFAQSKDTGEQGFIPSNYVSQFGSLETQE